MTAYTIYADGEPGKETRAFTGQYRMEVEKHKKARGAIQKGKDPQAAAGLRNTK